MAGWHGFLRLRMTRNVFEDSFCQANRILVFAKAELSGLHLFAHDLSHPFALPELPGEWLAPDVPAILPEPIHVLPLSRSKEA